MAGNATRIAVQSRRRLVRDALCAYLASRPEFTVVGQTASMDTMLALCALRRPDVVLIDAEPTGTPTIAELRRDIANLRQTPPPRATLPQSPYSLCQRRWKDWR